jgi:hypothetical protein
VPSGVVVPVYLVEEDGTLLRSRTLERPNYNGNPTTLLVGRGKRIDIVKAYYSEGRQPGTWHRVEPAS